MRGKMVALAGLVVVAATGFAFAQNAKKAPGWWKPAPNLRVQILSEDEGSYAAQVRRGTQIVVIEGVKADYADLKSEVESLRTRGVRVVCYHSLGWEKWRPDIGEFPQVAIGDKMADWDDEHWADTRPNSPAHAFWDRRYENFARAGCDCVEDDNMVDPTKNASGFPITHGEAAASAAQRARKAHRLGMCHIAKNNPSMAADYANSSDGVHIEEALQYNERAAYLPWRNAGRYAVMIEYDRKYCRPYPGFTVLVHPAGDYFDGRDAAYCD
jgi:hypothetical protein